MFAAEESDVEVPVAPPEASDTSDKVSSGQHAAAPSCGMGCVHGETAYSATVRPHPTASATSCGAGDMMDAVGEVSLLGTAAELRLLGAVNAASASDSVDASDSIDAASEGALLARLRQTQLEQDRLLACLAKRMAEQPKSRSALAFKATRHAGSANPKAQAGYRLSPQGSVGDRQTGVEGRWQCHSTDDTPAPFRHCHDRRNK
jgi:hypothetical protein